MARRVGDKALKLRDALHAYREVEAIKARRGLSERSAMGILQRRHGLTRGAIENRYRQGRKADATLTGLHTTLQRLPQIGEAMRRLPRTIEAMKAGRLFRFNKPIFPQGLFRRQKN